MDQKQRTEIKKTLYQKREPSSIKSDFGRSLLIGGSLSYPGALLISSLFAKLSGNGYVALALPDNVRMVAMTRAPLTQIFENIENKEDSFTPIQDLSFINKYDSLLFGNGIKSSEENRLFLKRLIEEYEHNLILDATALMLLASNPSILGKKNPKSTILLTPHLREAKAILHSDISSRNPDDYEQEAKDFCEKYHVAVLLKSAQSLLVLPNKKSLSCSYPMTPCLAKAGTGDGLSGYLAGLLSYGTKSFAYEDIVLFADSMIHEAARQIEEGNTEWNSGTASILEVYKVLERILSE